jgi:hypothetical protein
MATTLTAIAPVLYSAAQDVSAEAFAAVNAIYMDFDNKGVAYGDVVKVPVVPAQAIETFTPANVAPAGAGAGAAEAVSVQISAQKKVSMVLTGEQIRSLENGENYQEWVRQWAAQAMRTLRNAAEIDACTAIKQGASRAIGTAGTTPFAASLDDLASVRKILRDNGIPFADPQFIGNSNTELNLLKLGIVQQAYAAGSDAERRSGVIGRQMGFQMRTSAGIASHTAGTATAFDIDLVAGYGPGDYVLHVDGGDGGSLIAGDILTIAGDTNKYVSNSAYAALVEEDITIGRPGLRQTAANGAEFTIGAAYTPNFAFERNAIVGVTRPPLIPSNPTIRTQVISDGMGMSYLFAEIDQYGQRTWEILLSWGFKVVQPEHVAMLLG